MRQISQVFSVRNGREANHFKIAGMAFQEQARVIADRIGVIAEMRFIRRADFTQDGAALGDHVGHAKRSANLDHLTARCDDRLARGQSGQDGQDRRRAIVCDNRRLSACEMTNQVFNMGMSRPAFAGFEIQFKRGVIRRDLLHRLNSLRGETGAPEIGVNNDPRRIDGGAQA